MPSSRRSRARSGARKLFLRGAWSIVRQALAGRGQGEERILAQRAVGKMDAQALRCLQLPVAVLAQGRFGLPALAVGIIIIVGQRGGEGSDLHLARRVDGKMFFQLRMPEEKEAAPVGTLVGADLQGADDIGQRRPGPVEKTASVGQLEGEKVVAHAVGRPDFLGGDRGGSGFCLRRQGGGAKFVLQKARHGADMQIEQARLAAAAPQFAHGKDKDVEGDEHERDQRHGEEDFQQREAASGGTPLRLRPDWNKGRHCGINPWIFAMRFFTSPISLERATGSDQVGRKSMKFSVNVSSVLPRISQTKVTAKTSAVGVGSICACQLTCPLSESNSAPFSASSWSAVASSCERANSRSALRALAFCAAS